MSPSPTTADMNKSLPDLSSFTISPASPPPTFPSPPTSLPSPRTATGGGGGGGASGLTINLEPTRLVDPGKLSPTTSTEWSTRRKRKPDYPKDVVRPAGIKDGEEAFELLVVGCGGGPLETNLSSYLVKPYSSHWTDGCTSLEAGSTLGAVATLVEKYPESFVGFGLGLGLDSNEQGSVLAAERRKKLGRGEEGKAAGKVWECVQCFAVTHAHLDHVQGLIISSGASLGPRPLYGTIRTLSNIDKVMDGGVWPRLAGWESDGAKVGRAYLYRNVPAPTTTALPLSPALTFQAYPLSHGLDPSAFHPKKPLPAPPPESPSSSAGVTGRPNGAQIQAQYESDHPECYDSTAFFVKESISGKGVEFLFFGDVEPDSISKRPLNWRVWQDAAKKIVDKKLKVIFLECSYPTSQPTEQLWGHLSPPFVLEELAVLAKAVRKVKLEAGVSERDATDVPLAGVSVVIIHIKDDILSLPVSPLPSPAQSPASSVGSGSTSPIRPRQRASLSAHYPLSMSPPLPSLPTRRASTASGYFPSKPSNLGSSSRKSSSASSTNYHAVAATAADAARRASMPGFVGSGTAGHQPGFEKLLQNYKKNGGGEEEADGSLRSSSRSFTESVPEEKGDHELTEEEETEEETVHERIERELNELEAIERTGVEFIRAYQGMRLVF